MKKTFVRIIMSAASLLVAAGLAFAVEVKTPDVKGAAKAETDKAKADTKAAADKGKADAKGTADKTKADAKATVDKGKADTKAAADKTKADAKATADKGKAKLVDINSASEAELKAIPGIGDTYAAKIVAGRPYANKSQLKSRNILPAPVYEKTKDLVVATQPKK